MKLYKVISRCVSSHCTYRQTVKSWQINKYGNTGELKLNVAEKIPPLIRPNDVLIKVHASSVNPIDVLMLGGYGSRVVGILRQLFNFPHQISEFPLTLGRDFSGVVMDTGQGANSLKPGDEVWGATGPDRLGAHAEYVIADACCVTKKPTTLTHVEAAALPYTALTAWSALCFFGQLSEASAHKNRVLILGGSGGVGTFAIQLLKAWGAEVTTSCSTDAVEMLHDLGADFVVDYTDPDSRHQLQQLKGFDFILDGVGGDSQDFALDLLNDWSNSKYVTVSSPTLSYIDQYGLGLGTLFTSMDAARDTIRGLQNGRSVRWAYFSPSQLALKKIKSLVDEGKIVPVVEKVFPFEEVPEAYNKVVAGHARGKTVIEVVKNVAFDVQNS